MSTSARIQIRRDTAANWTSANPTLAAGEPAVETDTGLQKIGDGTTAWVSLAYASSQVPASVVSASSIASGKQPISNGSNGYAWQNVGVTTLPDSTGVDDTSAINAILALGGRIRGKFGQTYKISAPLVLAPGGNTELDMTGCTVQFTSTAIQCNMLQNSAVTPTATATDVATTATSSIITSPALVAAGAAIGMQVAVVPVSGIWLYGTISLVSGNNITLSGNVNGVQAGATGSSLTGYLYASRDSRIRVIGGIWNAGVNWNTLAVRQAAGANSHQLRFRRADDLYVSGVTVQLTSFPQGGGLVYGIAPGDVTNCTVENCRGAGSSTVVQCTGPFNNGTFRNIYGTTQDDMVATCTIDAVQAADVEGDVTNLLIEGVFPTGSWTAVKLQGGQAQNNLFRISTDMTIRSVKGTVASNGVAINDFAGIFTVDAVVEDIAVTPGSGFSSIYIAASRGQDIFIRNVKWSAQAPVSSVGAINLNNLFSCHINGLDMRGGAGSYIGVYVNGVNAQYINVSNVSAPDSTMTGLDVIKLNAGSVDKVSLSHARVKAPGNLVNNALPMATEVVIEDCRAETATFYASGSGTNATTLRTSNSRTGATAPITAKHPLTWNAVNTEVNTASGVLQLNGTNATGVVAKLATLTQNGAGALYTLAASAPAPTMTGSPSLQSGTVALTAGASGSIAATPLTATGRIRLTNIGTGGTVGVLSAAITAGTGFVINSSSGTDTSTVFWEIVQY